jgi:quercetin dioxygenase-like cupin family protein
MAATVLGAVVLVGVFALSSTAQEPPPPPIATEVLTARAVFPDDIDLRIKIKSGKIKSGGVTVVNVKDPSRTVVARFTVQPGAQFPWHSHAGPVVVNIVEGELVYIEAEGCAEHTYTAGTAFVDPGSHVHSAVNRGDEPTVLVATFFGAPAEGPLSIPADPADC